MASWNGSCEASRGSADQRLEQAHQLQNTFTAVLAQSGRQGFASAEVITSEQPVETAISSSWNEWFDHFGAAAYRDVTKKATRADADDSPAEQLKQDFGQILVDAAKSGGYAAPLEFLQGLSGDQLTTLQTIHRLAAPIDVYQLKDEGAANLLLPPPAQVDFDGDGLTQVGIGQTIRFPDSSTPRDVRDAWEAATADLSSAQRMVYELQMKLPMLTANIHSDDQGVVSVLQPGDAQWINPMASPSYSYGDAVRERLEYLDAFKNQIPPDRWDRDHDFWSKFASLLEDAHA